MKTRVVMAAMLPVLLLASVGCTAPTPPGEVAPGAGSVASSALETAPSPLELAETGYRVIQGPYVTYGFVLRNPNADAGAVSTTVRITMRDAAGAVLGTEEEVVKRIMPGATVALGGERADPHLKVPATVEFEVLDPGPNWRPADQMPPADFKPLIVTGQKASVNGSTTSFMGEITNANGAAFEEVCLSLLLRDKDGQVFYGGYSVIDGPAANATMPVRADILGVPEYATFALYAQPW